MLVLEGALQRLLFACSMGLFAFAGSAVLWVVSLPSVAMRIMRWQFSAVSEITELTNNLKTWFALCCCGAVRVVRHPKTN